MILAHLPAGYVLARALGAQRGPVLIAALIGSVLPDADMIWFHLVDDRAIHHHRYWVHIPGFWLLVAVVALPALRWLWPPALRPAIVFCLAIGIHLILDSVGGGILWLWPFDDRLYSLLEIPPTRSHWILSFLTHWSVLAEVAIIVAAAMLLRGQHKSAPRTAR